MFFVRYIIQTTDKSEKLQLILEYDLIDFAQSKGRNMSKIIEILKREKGRDLSNIKTAIYLGSLNLQSKY